MLGGGSFIYGGFRFTCWCADTDFTIGTSEDARTKRGYCNLLLLKKIAFQPQTSIVLEFDHKGLLFPAEIHHISREKFEQFFVSSFPTSKTRLLLYEAFSRYTEAFKSDITETFAQWIGGSFTTQKLNPNDLDLVTILPVATFSTYEEKLRSNFGRQVAKQEGLDVYFLEVRPQGDPKFPLWNSNYTYWYHQFSTSRKDRFGKRHPRGFVQLTYNSFNYENV